MPNERDDHFIYELVDNPNSKTGKSPKVTSPSQVVPIPDKEELELQLKHYSRPFTKHVCPDDPRARRFYVEKIRPALRYYCHKFGVKIPDWLKDDSYFKEMSDSEKHDMFGSVKLRIVEFKPQPQFGPGGQVHR